MVSLTFHSFILSFIYIFTPEILNTQYVTNTIPECVLSWFRLLSGFSVHGISQVRKLEYVAIYFSQVSSSPWDRTCVSSASCIVRWVLHHYATWEVPFLLLRKAEPVFFSPLKKHILTNTQIFVYNMRGLVNYLKYHSWTPLGFTWMSLYLPFYTC